MHLCSRFRRPLRTASHVQGPPGSIFLSRRDPRRRARSSLGRTNRAHHRYQYRPCRLRSSTSSATVSQTTTPTPGWRAIHIPETGRIHHPGNRTLNMCSCNANRNGNRWLVFIRGHSPADRRRTPGAAPGPPAPLPEHRLWNADRKKDGTRTPFRRHPPVRSPRPRQLTALPAAVSHPSVPLGRCDRPVPPRGIAAPAHRDRDSQNPPDTALPFTTWKSGTGDAGARLATPWTRPGGTGPFTAPSMTRHRPRAHQATRASSIGAHPLHGRRSGPGAGDLDAPVSTARRVETNTHPRPPHCEQPSKGRVSRSLGSLSDTQPQLLSSG